MYAEIKYDGERVQVHKQGDRFEYFSRSLKPVGSHKVYCMCRRSCIFECDACTIHEACIVLAHIGVKALMVIDIICMCNTVFHVIHVPTCIQM